MRRRHVKVTEKASGMREPTVVEGEKVKIAVI